MTIQPLEVSVSWHEENPTKIKMEFNRDILPDSAWDHEENEFYSSQSESQFLAEILDIPGVINMTVSPDAMSFQIEIGEAFSGKKVFPHLIMALYVFLKESAEDESISPPTLDLC